MPSARLTLREDDVVRLALEFLHNRELHITQLSLERETGVINGSHSDDVLFLRQLILDGQWDDVMEFIQPLEALPAFDSRKFRYCVLRRKYEELLCIKSEAVMLPGTGANVDNAVEEVVKVLRELEKVCPSKEEYSHLCLLLTLPKLNDHLSYQDWNPSHARVLCFREVLPIVEKFLPSERKLEMATAKNDRLIQLIIKGILYESCVNFCQAKATGSVEPQHQQVQFTKLLDCNSGLGDSDLSLISWLQSVPPETFSVAFEQRTLNVDVEKLDRPTLETSWTEHMLVTPIKPKTFPHSAMPFTRPRSAADVMSRSLLPTVEGLSQSLLAAAADMSRSSFASFHLTGYKNNKLMNTSVDRLFENDNEDVFLSSTYAEFPQHVDASTPKPQPADSKRSSAVSTTTSSPDHRGRESPSTTRSSRRDSLVDRPPPPVMAPLVPALPVVVPPPVNGDRGEGDGELMKEFHRQKQRMQDARVVKERQREEFMRQISTAEHQEECGQKISDMAGLLIGDPESLSTPATPRTSVQDLPKPSTSNEPSSRSMTNLAEPIYMPCGGSDSCNFRNYSVCSSGSVSCLSSHKARFALGPRRPQCCLHSSCSNVSSVSSSRSDSNWSLASLSHLGPARPPLPRSRQNPGTTVVVRSGSSVGPVNGTSRPNSQSLDSTYDTVKPPPSDGSGDGPGARPRFVAVTSLEDVQAVRCAEFHPSGKVYAVGSNSKTLRICAYPKLNDLREDHTTYQPTVLFKRTRHHKGSIYCMAWTPVGDLMATGSNDKTVKLMKFNPDTNSLEGQEIELSMHDGTVRDLCFLEDTSNKSSLLISGGAGDCKIYVTDCATGSPYQALSGHSGHVLSLYNWGGAMFASGSQDKTVRFWDLRTRGCVNMVTPTTAPGNRGSPVAALCVDPSGRLLVSGHEDSSCVLYDIRGGRNVQCFKPHSSDVRSIRFSPSAYYLLTAGYDNKLVLTDLQGDLTTPLPSVVVAQHQDKAISGRWHPSEFSFLSTSADKTATLWALPPV